ncbi:hypothetical protein [Flavobacterium fluviatile]|uniref:hypothetical protein n=1 Tax=Flavobacterium fluviatile TaxID=1862387 RepID=UPI0013D172DA|nr:hypothetical protein [Flavobacterium fluviatile]
MGLIKAIQNWKEKVHNSDLQRIRVTSGGAFYMKSEDIFNDKEESIELLKKLNASVDKYNKASKNHLTDVK